MITYFYVIITLLPNMTVIIMALLILLLHIFTSLFCHDCVLKCLLQFQRIFFKFPKSSDFQLFLPVCKVLLV